MRSPERIWTITPEILRKRTIQVCAGPLAESILNKHEADVRAGAEGDEGRIWELAERAVRGKTLSDDERLRAATDYVLECKGEAVALIDRERPALAAIANTLLANISKEMPGSELRRVFEQAREVGRRWAVRKGIEVHVDADPSLPDDGE